MTTSTTIGPAQKITVLKHSIAGKDTTFITTVTRLTDEQVRQIQQSHGYPHEDKMRTAIGILEKKIDDAQLAEGMRVLPDMPSATTTYTVSPSSQVVTKPDEIRVLLNTAKAHPSKRIQNAANKVFDDLDKLRALIKDDEDKHAAARAEKAKKEAAKKKAEEEKAAARAEVERLEAQLREAKARLKPAPSSKPRTPKPATTGDGPTAADIRAWAAERGIDCPPRGIIPGTVREAYALAHPGDAA